MLKGKSNRGWIVAINPRAALLVLAAFVMATLTSQHAESQTYSVLHNFTGGQDGATPKAGVTFDQAGNMYGTASTGASFAGNCDILGGCGTVYELKHHNSGWLFNPLYTFQFSDGATPQSRVVFGPGGLLYGTGTYGGNVIPHVCANEGCGVVFSLRPPATVCKSALCPWTQAALHKFDGYDGAAPCTGDLIFDQSGNLYGTAAFVMDGEVFELSPSGSGWTLNILYEFPPLPAPGYINGASSVIFDPEGNLYGATQIGGPYNGGAAYEITPSSPYWTFLDLHDNTGEEDGGLMRDSAGNFYGTTFSGGDNGGGTVYELSPSNGGWTFTTLYSFSGTGGSWAVLTMDAGGNLYGTTLLDGAHGQGNIFKLTPSDGGWTYTSLHDFTGGSDGGQPYSQVTLDANGNLYGTASIGGANNRGVVWEITP